MPLPEEIKDFGRSLGSIFVRAGKTVHAGFKEKADFTIGLGKDILRAGPRAAAAVTNDIVGQKTYTPGARGGAAGKLDRFLLGPQPVESISTQIEKLPGRGEALGIPSKVTKPLAVPLVVGSTLLDLLPGGGGRKTLVKKVAKEMTEDGVFTILKNEVKGITDLQAETLATRLAPLKDEQSVAGVLEGLSKDMKASKSAARERGFVTSVKEKYPENMKVAGQYIPRSTDELAQAARNLVRDDIKSAEKMALNGTDDKSVATASELIKHYGDSAALAPDSATKAALEDKMAEVANVVARNLTEQGRAIQAASILGRMTPEGQVRFAAREIQKYNEAMAKSKLPFAKKIPEITGEQAGKIVEKMRDIADMPDGLPKVKAFKELQDSIDDMVPAPLMKKIATVWKAGLLTGLKTSGLNIFANTTHFAAETIKDVPAVAVDKVASLFTGVRTKAFTTHGAGKGLIEGFEKGWSYFKTGVDERDMMSKLDYRRVNFGESAFAKSVQKYEETVFRVLGSEDQPFYYGMKARSLTDQAIARGKTLELKGDDLAEFVKDSVKNPDDEMLRYAAIDAETAVFQNKTALGDVGKSIQDIGKGSRAEGIGEFVLPFSRTPSAVAMQILNYTPVGIVRTIVENIGKGKFDQRLFAQGIGRGLTGTAGLYLGTKLFDKGIVTLDFPKDEREQKLWELEGRKPNSIKVGDKWRTVQILGPAGNLLLIGGYFQRSYKDTGSPTQAIAQASIGGAKSLVDQTFLHGLKSLMDAINDPERFGDAYFGNLTASFVPTIVSDVARATDLKERVSRTTLDRVKARIPFIREQLEPRVDVLGREVSISGNPLEVMLDPSRPSKDVSTPVAKELRRLTTAGFKVSPTLLGDKHGYESLTPEQNTQLWRDAGGLVADKLEGLFVSPAYLEFDDEKKSKTIESFVEKAKLLARAKTLIEITDGLSGATLKEQLSKQKAGGFMTKEVYKKFLELRGSDSLK